LVNPLSPQPTGGSIKHSNPIPSQAGWGFSVYGAFPPAPTFLSSRTEAESIGWLPQGEGAYLPVGKPDEEAVMISVTGVADAGIAG